MAYSSLPFPGNTNLENLRVIAEDTTIYIAPANNGLGKTGSAPGWTGLTWGNDTTGDGTLAKPYATLKKAWDKAQDYIVTGDAILTIQFQKGIYGYTYDLNDETTNPFPQNLHHPQGQNIVIQGDLNAIKQRYIYSVKDYSWDMSRWSQYGHTGTVNTWYGSDKYGTVSSINGTTSHGFTGEDEGCFAAVTNAFMGGMAYWNNSYYLDRKNGVYSGNKYQRGADTGHHFGRYFFNHGLSYEEANAICGLSKIESAAANPYDLKMQFKYQNLDGRIMLFPQISAGANKGRLDGGLGNALDYAEISSNYPEPQYSVPNGYYGPTASVNSSNAVVQPNLELENATTYGKNQNSGANWNYPGRDSGQIHITDDAHLLTLFPVVIRVNTANNEFKVGSVPLLLDGSSIRSIRNLMFVNANYDKPTYASTNICEGMDAQISMSRLKYPMSPLMVLKNGASTSVRHIGIHGYGFGKISDAQTETLSSTLDEDSSQALGQNTINLLTIGASVVVNKSTLFIDRGIDFKTSGNRADVYSDGPLVYAELGALHNCPFFVISHGGGIRVSDSGKIIGNASDNTGTKAVFNADNTTWVQASISSCLAAQEDSFAKLDNIVAVCSGYNSALCSFRLNIPVFPGATLGGSTAAFYIPNVFDAGRGSKYKSVVGYLREGSTRTAFTRVVDIIGTGITYTTSGWSAGTGFSGGTTTLTTTTLRPSYSETVRFEGYRIGGGGNADFKMDNHESAVAWLNGGAGRAIEFFAYSDNAEGVTIANEYYSLSAKGFTMGISAGYTLSGLSANNGGSSFGLNPKPVRVSGFLVGICGSVDCQSINQSGHHKLVVDSNSTVDIGGYAHLSGKSYVGSSSYRESNLFVNVMMISEWNHSGHLSDLNGSAVFGNIFMKNPCGNGINYDYSPSPYGYGLYSRGSGEWRVGRGGSAIVSVPLHTHNYVNHDGKHMGFYSINSASPTSVDFGDHTPLYISYNSLGAFSGGYGVLVAGHDGGRASMSSSPSGSVMKMELGADAYGVGSLRFVYNPTQGIVSSNFPRIMTRGGWNDSTTYRQWLYNAPRGATMWWTLGVGSGGSGWVSSSSAVGSVPTFFASLNTSSNASNPRDRTITTPQINAAYNAGTPGFSGPALTKSTADFVSLNYNWGRYV
jgi:hypothetical protein